MNMQPQNVTDSASLEALRLFRSRRVGPKTFWRLLSEAGSLEVAFEALLELAKKNGVKDYQPCSHDQALREYEAGCAQGGQLITYLDPEYPPQLREIESAPPVFWIKGHVEFLTYPQLAIVGARNASALGIRFTQFLARDLGRAGYTITSGLARGIDTAAHIEAISRSTIGVVAGGFDIFYPKENEKLQAEIGEYGCIVSELPPGIHPQSRHFPQRNRIIAALAQATIVVEGSLRSGSMITARDALDIGREVMAVPGNPLEGRSAGPNALIRQGATLIRSAEDVLACLTPDTQHSTFHAASQVEKPHNEVSVSALEHSIITLLGTETIHEDWLAEQMDVPPNALFSALAELEIMGKIKRVPNGGITRILD